METPAISTPLLGFFRRIVRGYFRRHFGAVRGSGMEAFVDPGGRLLVYANHGSWWDPMVSIFLAERLLSGRGNYAPMDAEALARYGILRRLGVFAVDMKSGRGAVQFLRTGQAIVEKSGVLWVTPQGRFVDTRTRPLEFRPGLAALAVRVAPCTVMPLAIEYAFWDERMPECLLRLGAAVRVESGETAVAVEVRLREALERSMDELKELSLLRDPKNFEVLLRGRSGAGGFYAIGERLKAFVSRRPYRAEHTARTGERE